MIILARTIPLTLSFFLFAVFAFMISRVTLFVPLVILLTVTVFVGFATLFRWRTEGGEFWNYFATLISFLGSGVGLLVFVSGTWIGFLLLLVLPALSGWYLQNLFWFRTEPHRYQPFALENITAYLLVLASFQFFATLLAMKIFLTLPMFTTLLLATVFSFFVFSQSTWTTRQHRRARWPYIAVGTLALLELFGAVATLPTGFLVGGFTLAVCTYVMAQVFRHALLGTLERKKIRRYAVLGGILLVIIFSTALWT